MRLSTALFAVRELLDTVGLPIRRIQGDFAGSRNFRLMDAFLNLSALATSKAWSRVNAAREIVAAGVSGEW